MKLQSWTGTLKVDGAYLTVIVYSESIKKAVEILKEYDENITHREFKELWIKSDSVPKRMYKFRNMVVTETMYGWAPVEMRNWEPPKHSQDCAEVIWLKNKLEEFLGLGVIVSECKHKDEYELTVVSPTGVALGTTSIWFITSLHSAAISSHEYFHPLGSSNGLFLLYSDEMENFKDSIRLESKKIFGAQQNNS